MKYPHVGYQNSSFFTRISMQLFNFRNILKKSFRYYQKKGWPTKNLSHNSVTSQWRRIYFFGVFILLESHHYQKSQDFWQNIREHTSGNAYLFHRGKKKQRLRLLVIVKNYCRLFLWIRLGESRSGRASIAPN